MSKHHQTQDDADFLKFTVGLAFFGAYTFKEESLLPCVLTLLVATTIMTQVIRNLKTLQAGLNRLNSECSEFLQFAHERLHTHITLYEDNTLSLSS